MPADQGRWLAHDEGLAPVKPTGKPDQSDPRGIGGALRCDMALLIQSELFAQKEILCHQSSAGAPRESEHR